MAPVCVTGGAGFLASWLIKLLLERGYRVRATVRDPDNRGKTAHLWDLPHANERLELFKADLLEKGSFDTIVDGCDGVFHMASPVKMVVENPQEDVIVPAVEGTLNVLNACAKSKTVRRVVLTSSMAAVSAQALARSGSIVVDENCWSDQAYSEERKMWYNISKLLAEQNAWNFAKERGLDLVVINPGVIVGRPLQPVLDVGSETVLHILRGEEFAFQNISFGLVDVRDTAQAHLLAFEVPTASGRYPCVGRVINPPILLEILCKIVPAHKMPPKRGEKPLIAATLYKVSTEKLKRLGLTCRPIEESLKETVDYLIEQGLLH